MYMFAETSVDHGCDGLKCALFSFGRCVFDSSVRLRHVKDQIRAW